MQPKRLLVDERAPGDAHPRRPHHRQRTGRVMDDDVAELAEHHTEGTQTRHQVIVGVLPPEEAHHIRQTNRQQALEHTGLDDEQDEEGQHAPAKGDHRGTRQIRFLLLQLFAPIVLQLFHQKRRLLRRWRRPKVGRLHLAAQSFQVDFQHPAGGGGQENKEIVKEIKKLFKKSKNCLKNQRNCFKNQKIVNEIK